MDIQFVEVQHREKVLNLMEICNIPLNEAYQLYIECGFNLQAAIQKKFNENSIPPQFEVPREQQYHQQPTYNERQMEFEDEEEEEYQKYKNFQLAGIDFNKKYTVKRHQGIFMRYVPKFFKGQETNTFKGQVQRYLEKKCPIRFAQGNLSERFQQIWKSKLPLIIHLYDFSDRLKPLIKQMLTEEYLVDIFNTQFRSYGLLPQYNIQPDLRRYVDYQRDCPGLLVFRVNLVDEIKLVDKINFVQTTTAQEVKKRLKLAKNACIQIELEELYRENRYKEELMGNFDYQKPKTNKDKKKILEDRAIRKKQEEDYKISKKNQQTNKKIKKEQTGDTVSEKIQKTEEKKQQKYDRNAINKKRQQIRKELIKYTQGISIKFRLPSEKSIMITVSQNQKVQYLFDFISSFQDQIGFENDNKRQFQIVRPIDKLYLSVHKDKTLKEVFEDSAGQSLVVSER